MNWLKRALLSLWGHKGRSILLILVFSILAMLIYCGLAVHSAAEQEIKNAKMSVGSAVILKGKRVRIQLDHSGAIYNEIVTDSIADKLLSSPYLKSYDYTAPVPILFDKIEPVCRKEELKTEKLYNLGDYLETATLMGIRDSASSDHFTAGGYQLISGRHITPSDAGKPNVMIEQQLANKNGLKVGDKFTICAAIESKLSKLSVTVVGIFRAPAISRSDYTLILQRPSNYIFTYYSEIYALYPLSKGNLLTATYQLDDPSHIAPFVAWGKKQIDNSKYEFVTNDSWYKRMTSPLGSIDKLSNLMTIIVVAAACAIMGLIAALSIHGRRREFGVLLSVGESRRKIILQVLAETILPVCISFCIAIAAGGFLAPIVGDKLLSQQVKNSSATKVSAQTGSSVPTNAYSLWTQHQNSFAQPVDKIKIDVSPVDVGGLAGVSIVIILVSAIIPCVSILRLSPSRVLNKKE